jgi:hypothetical protein
MYPYMNEDAMFERLKDLQREAENSRLMTRSAPRLGTVIRNVAERAWWLAGFALQRPPRPRPSQVRQAREESTASDAA